MRLIKKANEAGMIAAEGFPTATPPNMKTSPVKNATVKFPTRVILFRYFEYRYKIKVVTTTMRKACRLIIQEKKKDKSKKIK